MNSSIRNQRYAVVGVVAAALLLFAWTTSTVGSQQASPTDPFLLSLEQLEALRQAWNNRLSYIPGEVLVKFRHGVTTAGRLRAMRELPGKIDSGRTRRVGDALLMKSVDERDAYRLASTLRSQPEVLWAQPNHFSPSQVDSQ